jgi:hypothetical protein
METSMIDWLASVGSRAFTVSAWLFLLVNGAAVAAFMITRDRALVNRWTGRLLAANLVLAGTGLGVPVLTAMARLAIVAMSPSAREGFRPSMDRSELETAVPPAARSR